MTIDAGPFRSPDDPILLTSDGKVTTVTFNRPASLNVVDAEMARAMRHVADALANDQESRVVVLRGHGPAFMAGGDVRAFAESGAALPELLRQIITDFHHFVSTLRRLPKPVLAIVHGSAAGGGLSLAAAADLTLAVEGTKFAVAYGKLGASPDGGSTFVMAALAGPKKVAELMFMNEVFDTRRALELGLINWVVSPEQLEAEVHRITGVLSNNAPAAVAATKALLNESFLPDLERQLGLELRAFLGCARSQDFAEGLRAFLDKRKPIFHGR